MKSASKIVSELRRLKTDRHGNFAIISAFALPAVVFGVGVALDTSFMVSTKYRLQNATDAGAAAAATALVNDEDLTLSEAKTLAKNYVTAQMDGAAATMVDDCLKADITETKGTGTQRTYTVAVTACADYSLSGLSQLFGSSNSIVHAQSTAQGSTGSQKALSMYLVLDRSGSMNGSTKTETSDVPDQYVCDSKPRGLFSLYRGRKDSTDDDEICIDLNGRYLSKIEALQIASFELLDQIKEADPDEMYARMGAVSYNNVAQEEQPLSWGTTEVAKYVRDLSASGNTNSAPAMTTAYDDLKAAKENAEHLAKNGQTNPSKFILFMTDGANNVGNADKVTLDVCRDAKNAGMEIYTVAFEAPPKGQALLSACANDSNHYFNAETSDDLIAAFKAIGEKAASSMTVLTQ